MFTLGIRREALTNLQWRGCPSTGWQTKWGKQRRTTHRATTTGTRTGAWAWAHSWGSSSTCYNRRFTGNFWNIFSFYFYIVQLHWKKYVHFYLIMQGLDEINPVASQLEESNALALAIISPGALACHFHYLSFHFVMIYSKSWMLLDYNLISTLMSTQI